VGVLRVKKKAINWDGLRIKNYGRTTGCGGAETKKLSGGADGASRSPNDAEPKKPDSGVEHRWSSAGLIAG